MSAPEKQYLHKMELPQGMAVAEITLPGIQLFHYITDSELEKLGDMRKEPIMEICLASVGVFFGSIIPAVEGLIRFGDIESPITWVDMLSVFLAIFSLSSGALSAFLWRTRSGSHKDLLKVIKGRDRAKVIASDDA